MSLPFLPLDPTLSTGTYPPAPAAAAAMDEALGLPEREVVRTILANLRAGDDEGAKEEACQAVGAWIHLAKQHHHLDKEEAVWAMLVRNVFPNAPTPTMAPISNKAWFYAMCKRYRDLREMMATPRIQRFLKYRELKEMEEREYEMIERLRRANANAPSKKQMVAISPLRQQRYEELQLRARRLRQQMDQDPYHTAMELVQARRRLTVWDPPYYPADYEGQRFVSGFYNTSSEYDDDHYGY